MVESEVAVDDALNKEPPRHEETASKGLDVIIEDETEVNEAGTCIQRYVLLDLVIWIDVFHHIFPEHEVMGSAPLIQGWQCVTSKSKVGL
jgi:hypothetical protein